MKKPYSHLKLHQQNNFASSGNSDVATAVESPRKGQLSRAFLAATGWNLRFTQGMQEDASWSTTIESRGNAPVGQLSLVQAISRQDGAHTWQGENAMSLEQARGLAMALAGLIGENENLRHAVRQREAELAAGVPVTKRNDEERHLSERLESVLLSGLQALGCTAAGLYLLDESTTQLKLRSAVGLPTERLLDDARSLRGAMADLEALVGHAVVLEDVKNATEWQCPEDYASAICVPVSSPTLPLGTLWIFSDEVRDFSDEETNIAEIIAGRLAADLEREMLLVAGAASKQNDKQLEAAGRWQQVRLPSVPPMVDELDLAGWTTQRGEMGGDFFDWTMLDDGRIAVTVADAEGKLLEAGLSAASVQAASKSHAAYDHTAAELLARINDTIWTTSAGDQFASFGYGLIDPRKGEMDISLAGNVRGFVARSENVGRGQWFTSNCDPLGSQPDTCFPQLKTKLERGDVLVLISGGVLEVVKGQRTTGMQAKLQACVEGSLRLSAKEITKKVESLLRQEGMLASDDQTVLVVKRRM